jgi:hypothetical protein
MRNENGKTKSSDGQIGLILTTIERLSCVAHAKLNPGSAENQTENNAATSPLPDSTRLKWTYSKVGLVELIYSLRELGAFNDGKADLKTIKECFEYMFNVDLGNITSSFQEILERKKGYTNITDKLREMFLKKIDNSLNT